MAKLSTYEVAFRNAGLDAQTALLAGGSVKLYDAGGVHLATGLLGTPACAAAVAGVATANAIASGIGLATGNAARADLCDAGGTVRTTGTVGTADTNIVMNSVAIQVGADVPFTALTLTAPETGA
ncbi:MAG: hypothetical protein H0X64_08170 [Gemmatimonadaceae bacterium]|nr:hypothetical protein [Gemmatimonadaceae bacterium]